MGSLCLAQMIRLSAEDKNALLLVVTPSWLSGLIAVASGLAITIFVIGAFSLDNSSVQQQLLIWQQTQPTVEPARTAPGTYVASTKPTLQNNWPLIIIWAIVGLIVYGICASLLRSLSRAAELKQSLNYVHAKPELLLRNAAQHIALRVVAGVVLIVLLQAFVRQILPYSITAAHASAADFLTVEGILYALISSTIVMVSLHLITIFTRLTFGRVRVFSQF